MVVALRRRRACQGNQVGFALVVQLAEAIDLGTVPQHVIQPVLSVPLFDAVHRGFGNIQGRRYLWCVPTLIQLEQDAGTGDDPRRTLAAANQSVQPFLFF